MIVSAAHLLTRYTHLKKGPLPVEVSEDFSLDRARIHEVCGDARRKLAIVIASVISGMVLWIRPAWDANRVCPFAFCNLINPARVFVVTLDRIDDLLWVMEEALRAGSVPLVIIELPEPPGLKSIRRLHLAAEAGTGQPGKAPLGLVLTPGDGGSAGVETRWGIRPAHGFGGRESWSLSRLRARMAPEKNWQVELKNGRLMKTPPPCPVT